MERARYWLAARQARAAAACVSVASKAKLTTVSAETQAAQFTLTALSHARFTLTDPLPNVLPNGCGHREKLLAAAALKSILKLKDKQRIATAKDGSTTPADQGEEEKPYRYCSSMLHQLQASQPATHSPPSLPTTHTHKHACSSANSASSRSRSAAARALPASPPPSASARPRPLTSSWLRRLGRRAYGAGWAREESSST
jgi:hypothetical protein